MSKSKYNNRTNERTSDDDDDDDDEEEKGKTVRKMTKSECRI